MTNSETKALCEALLDADSEEKVIEILSDVGYWQDNRCWRLYGDRDGNFATIGNQQSRSDAALVEKIVNSVDARLMNACLSSEIDPTSADAPQTIRKAVGRYFEGREDEGELGGKLHRWTSKQRRDEGRHITLAATGSKRRACLTLVDTGEGQTPNRMPETFLSIDKDNKLKIPFVQGKFNMGGTGVLKFCGKESLELIISRRNPQIVSTMDQVDDSSDCWGFTVVRRERSKQQVGAVRHSCYTYLAPLGAEQSPRHGSVLRFQSDTLALMPNFNKPYVREIEWGSAVKLYDYDMKGYPSHILMKDGLLYRLEILLPEIALPVNLHECRSYQGKTDASFVTTLSGLMVRLEEGKGGNLEDGFPSSVPFSVRGERMAAKIYAFRKGKADTYRTNEGVIFTINGQTHGNIPKTIFTRKSVKMGRLADSLLVTVDCSAISVDAREDLFMNSRDRLSSGELRKAVETELEEILHKHPGLRALRDQRRNQEISERLEDSRPLEDVLDSILKSSPSLASLFLKGRRLSQPHKRTGRDKGTSGSGENGDGKEFSGKPHPTYFRFHKRKDGETFERTCELGRRCRLTFETDVENEYFTRNDLPGKYEVEVLDGPDAVVNHSLTLHNGFAHWNIDLPEETSVGDRIVLQCSVTDEVIGEGFVNIAKLTVTRASPRDGGNGAKRRSRKGQSGGDGELPSGLQFPEIKKVKEEQWEDHNFDRYSACRVVIDDDIVEGGKEETAYSFYVNVDNICLRTDIKNAWRDEPEVAEAKFVYGNVLVGLALLQDYQNGEHQRHDADGNEEQPVEDRILKTSRALAPFLVPMINYLGALSSEEVMLAAQAGDDE